MSQSILDRAAEVRQKAIEVKALCNDLRRAGKEWTMLEIASEEAAQIANDGIRNAWVVLDRIYQLGVLERDRKAKGGCDGG